MSEASGSKRGLHKESEQCEAIKSDAVKQLTQRGYEGLVAATAQYNDEVEALKEEGVDAAFSFYAEAGLGFADHVCRVMEKKRSE